MYIRMIWGSCLNANADSLGLKFYTSNKLTDAAYIGCSGTPLWVETSPRTQVLSQCITLIVCIKHMVNKEENTMLGFKVYKIELKIS